MYESCQKIDLLRVSLERSLSELPPGHPKQELIKQDLQCFPSSGGVCGKDQSFSHSITSLIKATALTGIWAVHGEVQNGPVSNTDLYLNLPGLLSCTGTLEIHLLGCQGLLENVPGRSRAASTHGSPDTKNFTRYKTGGSGYGRGGSGRYLRTDELSGMSSLRSSLSTEHASVQSCLLCKNVM